MPFASVSKRHISVKWNRALFRTVLNKISKRLPEKNYKKTTFYVNFSLYFNVDFNGLLSLEVNNSLLEFTSGGLVSFAFVESKSHKTQLTTTKTSI